MHDTISWALRSFTLYNGPDGRTEERRRFDSFCLIAARIVEQSID
jgi:hypothetical protein